MPKEIFTVEKITEKRSWLSLQGCRVAIDRLDFSNGTSAHQVCWSVGGKRMRRARAKEEEAVEEAKSILRALVSARGDSTQISSEELAYLLECKRKLGDAPLHAAVNYYLKHFPKRGAEAHTVKQVCDDYESRKKSDTELGARYLETLKHILKSFVTEFGPRKIASLQADEVEKYIKNGRAPKTQSNHYTSLSGLFTFARKKRFLPPEEDTIFTSIEPPNVRPKTPPVFSPADMIRILRAADERDMPFIAISAFGGGRRAEIQRLTFDDIDFDERIIKLDTEKTKTGQRRTLDICDNLYDWLLPYRDHHGPIVTTWDPLWRVREKLAEDETWKWKDNGLRHSFISYHLMLHRNAPLTAELAGNSVRMINSNYKSLVTRAAAEAWFCITRASITNIP